MIKNGGSQFNPLNDRGEVVVGQDDVAGINEENVEELKQKIKELEDVLTEYWEYNNNDEGQVPTLTYSVPHTGVLGEAEWVPNQKLKDINNMGYKDVAIQIKSDQEPSIVTVQEYMRFRRDSPIVPTNSPVGESECNGRAENAIRRVKEKTRTLMAQIEEGIKEKLPNAAAIIPWMVRWSGELISKYAPTQQHRLVFQ